MRQNKTLTQRFAKREEAGRGTDTSQSVSRVIGSSSALPQHHTEHIASSLTSYTDQQHHMT